MKETIGLISGFLVIVSVVPYAMRTFQRKIKPNLVSWSIWTVIGLALLLTYKSSGAEDNIWPAVFGFTNPLIITVIAFWRGERNKPNSFEITCVVFAVISLALWFFFKDSRELSKWALLTAIIADACAAVPTAIFLFKNPLEDRPFAWGLFAIGYGLALFAVPECSFANMVLPVYMFIGASLMTFPMVCERVKLRKPGKEWI